MPILTLEKVKQIDRDLTRGQSRNYTMWDFALAVEQAVIHEESKPDNIKRAEYYGEGFADGWVAAVEKAAQICESMYPEFPADAIRELIKPSGRAPAPLPDEAMAGEQEID